MLHTIDFFQRLQSFFSGITGNTSHKELYTTRKLFDRFFASVQYYVPPDIKTVEKIWSFLPQCDSFIATFSEEVQEEEVESHPFTWSMCFLEAEKILPEVQRWEPEAGETEVYSLIGTVALLLYTMLLHNRKVAGGNIARKSGVEDENLALTH